MSTADAVGEDARSRQHDRGINTLESDNTSINSLPSAAPPASGSNPDEFTVAAAAPSIPSTITSPKSSQHYANNTAGPSRSSLSSPRRAPATSITPRAGRKDVTGSSQSGATASNYLSSHSASHSAPSASLFGFLSGPRSANEDASVNQTYGWRALSASHLASRLSNAEGNQRSSSYIPSRDRNNDSSQRQSFPLDYSTADTGWIAGRNRNSVNGGATVAALQQQHHQNSQQQAHHIGSPARRHAPINGASSPWLSALHGQSGYHHHAMASSSGWTLADPAAWSGWSTNAGKACSSFEENQIVAFTWSIPEASLLRDEVETTPLPSEGARSVSAGAGKNEIWTTQPIFGDGKWKLELVRTSRQSEGKDEEKDVDPLPESEDDTSTTVLSVYITSMVLDYSPADMEIPATIMIGIRPVQSQSKASRSGSWIWQDFSNYIFRRENEYFECHNLPSMTDLMQNVDIQSRDAFSLTIQISTGPRAASRQMEQGLAISVDMPQNSPFVVKDNHLVHHSLMNGLESLLDSRSTGDVVLIARERGVLKTSQGCQEKQNSICPLPLGMPMYDWAQLDAEKEGYTPIMVRDRCLWAHSSILCARSEFFRDMLQSNFAEGREQSISLDDQSNEVFVGGRKIKTLRIDNADFTTMYWLLRYLYLEEVEFATTEDVRCAALDDDWITLGLPFAPEEGHKALWQWTALTQLETIDDTSYSSGSSANMAVKQTPSSMSTFPDGSLNREATRLQGEHNSHPSLSRSDQPLSQSHQQVDKTCTTTSNPGKGHSSEDPNDPSTATDGHATYQSLHEDPEDHPCAKASLAIALALYKLAHRFNQQELLQLTKAHLINTLNPHSAFQTLLASFLYTDLYDHVKAYVLDQWDQVSNTKEFERCCDEVSAGDVSAAAFKRDADY